MANKLNRTLIGAAVLAALSGAPVANAFDVISIDRDGTGGASGTVDIANLSWAASTVLLDKAFTLSVDPDTGTKTQALATSYTLWTQAFVSGFVKGDSTSVSAIPGTEWTFQLGSTQAPTAPLDSSAAGQVSYSSQQVASPTISFFKIFYDPSADAINLPGTGFGDDFTATGANSCNPTAPGNTVGGQVLILCGTILDGGVNAILKTATTAGDTGAIKVALDGFGVDNYDGIADGTDATDTKAIGTSRSPASGGGSLDVNVDVTYQNFDFFKSNVSTVNVGIDLNHNANLKLNFQQTDPSRMVVGQTWDVGTDSDTVTDPTVPIVTTRVMNNFACNAGATATDTACSFVAQSTGTTSFNGNIVPEPDTLALAGLGLLSIGFGALRRRKQRLA